MLLVLGWHPDPGHKQRTADATQAVTATIFVAPPVQ